MAIASGVPAALSIIVYMKSEPAGETASIGRRIARWIGLYAMVIIASVSGTGAGWLFWTSHRGEFRPYADVRDAARPGCRDEAVTQKLKGAARSEYVRWCADKAVAAADAADD